MNRTQAVIEKITLPTYREPEAQDMPMFAENRVHQRSSGDPYPQKVVCEVDRAGTEEKEYTAVRLENDYLRVVLLPQLGGRIFEAYDKVNDYHFFYRQHVIKPALIGLLGSWISGGVEFNWPCHHRPSTFMPTDYTVEYGEGGAATVWMSENEPLSRMKGMVGVRLAPDEAAIDTLMRVYNRTAERRSFLWWENAAVPVNQQYRIFFPHDVRYVQFHYRQNVTTYPLATGLYNGINMGRNSVDIRLHKNTHQPTSYFCGETSREFFGGYDEGVQRGVVHYANRHLSIGKKMFTWAYNQLSQSWERALTDTDGAYAELMASSYSANQPDFGWLEPYETKTFSQRWYPIGAMGVPDFADADAAARLDADGVWLQTTKPLLGGRLTAGGREYAVDAQPGQPVFVPCGRVTALELRNAQGDALLSDFLPRADETKLPDPLPAVPSLDQPADAQSLYLRGVHVDQYRDPAIQPDAFYREALQRDPRHIPSLLALAEYEYRNGRYSEALALIERCRKQVTVWNYHPETGRIEYALGLILEALGREDEAYDAFYRAYWNLDARAKAMTRIAMLDGRRGDYRRMLEHAEEALRTGADNATAMAARAAALRRLGREADAQAQLNAALAMDAEDGLALALRAVWGDNAAWVNARESDPCQQALDYAYDLMNMGEREAAASLLSALTQPVVMTAYTRAYLAGLDTGEGKRLAREAEALDFGHAYPLRHEEETVLRAAIAADPHAVKARFGLACLEYHRRNYEAAYTLWNAICDENPSDVQALRCLSIACYSHMRDKPRALALLRRAVSLQPENKQLTWELAYLMGRMHVDPMETARFLAESPVCDGRDDLALERARALNLAGKWREALALLTSRSFVPCEGGEHANAEQYMFAHYALGRAALLEGDARAAAEHFRAAQKLPDNLGAGLWNEVLLVPHKYYEGVCLRMLGDEEAARACFRYVADMPKDFFSDMHLPELPCYQALAARALGEEAVALQLAARHYQAWQRKRETRSAGFYKTTPFFIAYTEDAAQTRDWNCDYHCGFALLCLPGREAEGKALLERCDPTQLYGALMHSIGC